MVDESRNCVVRRLVRRKKSGGAAVGDGDTDCAEKIASADVRIVSVFNRRLNPYSWQLWSVDQRYVFLSINGSLNDLLELE